MLKNVSKIFLVFFFFLVLFFPHEKVSAVYTDCPTRCGGDSDCSSYPNAICTADHNVIGIPKMCCVATCTTDAECPTGETFYDSAGAERPRYCLPEGRCARNGDPPPPAPTVGECSIDSDCSARFPDRQYCLLRPGALEGNICVRCKEDSECPAGQYCTTSGTTPGTCQVSSERNCCYDSDCPGANEICWSETTSLCTLGHCCKASSGCTNDADCQGRRCLSIGTLSYCEKSSLPPAAGSVAFGGRCATASECSGSYGCRSTGAMCNGTCGDCADNQDCSGKGAGLCQTGSEGTMCGAEAGVSCASDADCERIHGLPGFTCQSGICVPTTAPTPPAPAAPPPTYEVTQPTLEIPIPGFGGFTKVLSLMGEAPNRYLVLPWIGEYIAAIYKYAIGIVGILAGLMLVVAGLVWLTAGGSAERIGTAKKIIGDALFGLVIALTSYLILYAINPNLVSFESLKVKFIERVDLTDWNPLTSSQVTEDTQYSGATPTTGSNNVPYFAQFRGGWENDCCGSSPTGPCDHGQTIGASGCRITSYSMVLKYYLPTQNINPGAVSKLGGGACNVTAQQLSQGGWGNIAVDEGINLDQVKTLLSQGKPIVLLGRPAVGLTSGHTPARKYAGHYIVLTGYDPGTSTFSVNDPGSSPPKAIAYIPEDMLRNPCKYVDMNDKSPENQKIIDRCNSDKKGPIFLNVHPQ